MRRAIIAALLFQICIQARADTGADRLRLADVLAEARTTNPNVRMTREAWEMEAAKIVSARTWADPKVGLNLEKIRRGRGPKSKNAGADMYMIEQEIPFPGKLSARAGIRHHAAKIAQYEYERAILDAEVAATDAYYELWKIMETLRIERAHSRILERFSVVSERQYAAGKASQRDVLRAQAEADKIMVDVANIEERLPAFRARLNAVMNRPVDSPLGLPDSPEDIDSIPDFADLDSATLSHNVDLQAARHHVEHSEYMLKEARYGWFPDLSVGWARMVDEGAPKFYNASLFLNLPLYFWKQRAEIRAAEAGLRHSGRFAERAENETLTDLRFAVAEVRADARSIKLYRASILPRSRKSLQVAESGYPSGRSGFLDVLDAQRQLLLEELAHAGILAGYGKARAALARVTTRPAIPAADRITGRGNHHE